MNLVTLILSHAHLGEPFVGVAYVVTRLYLEGDRGPLKANRDHLTRKEGNTNNLINQDQDKIKLGKDVKTDRATGPSEANARSSQADGVPFGPKEVPVRLTEDHQARAIQIVKGLSQTDKELTQAISSQI